MPRDVGVVVAAAGRGERAGGGEVLKQFRPVAGVPLLLRALRPFLSHPAVADVVAVLPPRDAEAPPEWLAPLLGERLRAVAGGATRMDSVEAGLRVLPASCTVVLIHDGARPFPDPGVINAVIEATRRGGGAIAAAPVVDTIKEGEARDPHPGDYRRIARTVARVGLWRAQTPQGFPRTLLEAAYTAARSAGFEGSDESALVERMGGEVVLIPDTVTNFKITTAEDFALAEALALAGR